MTNNKLRTNFSNSRNANIETDFLDIQIKSFQDFFQLETKSDERVEEGLFNTFKENFPITDARNQFVLEFLDYFVDPPRYSMHECIQRGLSYSVPLKARLKLFCTDVEHEDFETIVQDVFLGSIPYMTPSGTFIINGAERVIVSQLHRSPGVFFGQSFHANGTKLYSARVIPFKGSWIEFATDINNVMYAYIDRKKKLPVTTLFRAIGYQGDKEILEIFDLAEEIKVTKAGLKKVLNRKLAARVLRTWFEDFVDEDTGEVISIERNEIILDRDTILEQDHIEQILDADVKTILQDAGNAVLGIGRSTGEQRAPNAAQAAISSPLLEANMDGAEGVLITITGSDDLKLQEINEAARVITERADDNAEIIFGHITDETMGDAVEVTVVAAGFGPRPTRKSKLNDSVNVSEEDGLPDFIKG